MSPIDVVLDNERALVGQPDVVFVARERFEIIRDQIWGAPDLVVEVASPRSARYDRTTKLGWYRNYGVREYWLVDPGRRSILVLDLGTSGRRAMRRSAGNRVVRSEVLPGLTATAAEYFEAGP